MGSKIQISKASLLDHLSVKDLKGRSSLLKTERTAHGAGDFGFFPLRYVLLPWVCGATNHFTVSESNQLTPSNVIIDSSTDSI